MRGSTTIFMVKDARASLASYRDCMGFRCMRDYGLRDFAIADIDGNMIFFATELKQS